MSEALKKREYKTITVRVLPEQLVKLNELSKLALRRTPEVLSRIAVWLSEAETSADFEARVSHLLLTAERDVRQGQIDRPLESLTAEQRERYEKGLKIVEQGRQQSREASKNRKRGAVG